MTLTTMFSPRSGRDREGYMAQEVGIAMKYTKQGFVVQTLHHLLRLVFCQCLR
jgi:hypothetical protein